MTHRLTAAFTGHRTYEHSADMALRDVVRRLYEEGVRTFRIGMAEGFDLAAGETVAALMSEHSDIRLVAIVPWAGFVNHFGVNDRRRYEGLLGAAHTTIYVAEKWYPGVYHRRNDLLVDGADVVVSWWNGRSSGTAYTVRRARRRSTKVINLYDGEQLGIPF